MINNFFFENDRTRFNRLNIQIFLEIRYFAEILTIKNKLLEDMA